MIFPDFRPAYPTPTHLLTLISPFPATADNNKAYCQHQHCYIGQKNNRLLFATDFQNVILIFAFLQLCVLFLHFNLVERLQFEHSPGIFVVAYRIAASVIYLVCFQRFSAVARLVVEIEKVETDIL